MEDTDQVLRNRVLKMLLEYRRLVQFETLNDSMTMNSEELKELSDACGFKLGDILNLFDEIVGGFHHEFKSD
jgi:hypothetical protein